MSAIQTPVNAPLPAEWRGIISDATKGYVNAHAHIDLFSFLPRIVCISFQSVDKRCHILGAAINGHPEE